MQESENRSREEILKDFDEAGGVFTYKLNEPIQNGSEEITEFKLEKPKAKHVRRMPQEPGMDAILKVIGSLSNQPDSVIDELCFEDMNKLAEFFSVFM